MVSGAEGRQVYTKFPPNPRLPLSIYRVVNREGVALAGPKRQPKRQGLRGLPQKHFRAQDNIGRSITMGQFSIKDIFTLTETTPYICA